MLEVVFGMSARGSLLIAQHVGERSYHGNQMVFVTVEGEKEPDMQLLEGMRRKQKARERHTWERATPLGGKASDIFTFPLTLSVGAIIETGVDETREQVLRASMEDDQAAKKVVRQAWEDLETLHRRMEGGEPVRIWYSDQADERCGLVWLLAQMDAW